MNRLLGQTIQMKCQTLFPLKNKKKKKKKNRSSSALEFSLAFKGLMKRLNNKINSLNSIDCGKVKKEPRQ